DDAPRLKAFKVPNQNLLITRRTVNDEVAPGVLTFKVPGKPAAKKVVGLAVGEKVDVPSQNKKVREDVDRAEMTLESTLGSLIQQDTITQLKSDAWKEPAITSLKEQVMALQELDIPGWSGKNFWHRLKEDGSKYRLTFMIDKKKLSLTLDDFRTIFHLPQANANNHENSVPPPSFLDMVPFYKQQLGFTMELKTSSRFKTTGLLQPWQTLCKIFSKCLTTHVIGWRYNNKVGMQILEWMISKEMNNTEHYRMYTVVFGLDVLLTQSQPIESTQGTHRTPSAPRRSTRLTPPAPVLSVDKADEMILQDTLQVNLAEHKSQEEKEARENVELVNKHLASEEIEKIIEGLKNVIDDSLPPRNDEPNIPGTRLEPRSDKESPEVEITNDKEQREKGKIVEESRSTPFLTPIRSPRIHTDLISSDTEKLQELMVRDQVQVYVAEGLILERKKTKEEMERMIAKAILQERGNIQAKISSQIQNAIDTHIPSQVDASVPQTTCRPSAVRPRDQDDPHDDA
ncbi:hypothetical protein Tco_0631281, partial [Tanacetum coccineum]